MLATAKLWGSIAGAFSAGSLTVIENITAAGVVGKVAAGPASASATITGTGVLGTVGSGSLTVTATTFGATGLAGVGSCTVTAAVSGVGVVARFGAAAPTFTAAITGIPGGGAAVLTTATITGAVTAVGSTSQSVTATITGAGVVGSGTATGSPSFTATITGSGVVGVIGSGSLTVTAPVNGASPDMFVSRNTSSGNLILLKQRFRFAGANNPYVGLSEASNSYGATTDSDGLYLAPHAEIDAFLNSAQSMNATGIRTHACANVGKVESLQPTLGVWRAASFEPIDYFLSQCPARGIKVIFPLVDNYQYFSNGKFWYCSQNGVTPDSTATQFFTNTTIVNSFKAHISAVLNHVNVYTGIAYKNDPSILAWETGNELTVYPTAWDTTYVNWTDDIAAYIKTTCGAQQLVMDGHADLDNTSAYDLSHVDIYTGHWYTGGSAAPNQVPQFAETIHSRGKAFVVGEYTWTDKDQNGSATFTIDSMLKNIEGCQFVDGDCFWELLAPLTNFGGGLVCHYPGDNSDMITRVGKLSAHAALMPTLTQIGGQQFLNDTFTDSNGVLLQNHTADSGAHWLKELDMSADGTIQSNRIWFGTQTYYVAEVYPPGPDYDVTGFVRIVSNATNATVVVRGRTGLGVASGYLLILWYDGSNYSLTLRRWAWDGSTFDIGSAVLPIQPGIGTDHTMMLRMVGSQLSAYWDGALIVGPTTNTDIVVTGEAGCGGLNSTSTTGIHLDAITAAVPKFGTGTENVTATITGTGGIGRGGSQTITATITGAGVLGLVGAATFTVAADISGHSAIAVPLAFAVTRIPEAALSTNHSGAWFAIDEAHTRG
jgi:hypothetical protein